MYKFLLQKQITLISKSKISFIAKCCSVFLLAFTSIKSSAQKLSGARNDEVIQYVRSDFSNTISDVIVRKNNIIIKGNISGNQSNLYLCELRMFDETKLVRDSF